MYTAVILRPFKGLLYIVGIFQVISYRGAPPPPSLSKGLNEGGQQKMFLKLLKSVSFDDMMKRLESNEVDIIRLKAVNAAKDTELASLSVRHSRNCLQITPGYRYHCEE